MQINFKVFNRFWNQASISLHIDPTNCKNYYCRTTKRFYCCLSGVFCTLIQLGSMKIVREKKYFLLVLFPFSPGVKTYAFLPQMEPLYQFLHVLKYFFLLPRTCCRAHTLGLWGGEGDERVTRKVRSKEGGGGQVRQNVGVYEGGRYEGRTTGTEDRIIRWRGGWVVEWGYETGTGAYR